MYEGLDILSYTALTHYPVRFSPLKLGSVSLNKISCHDLECVIAVIFLAINVTITFASILSGTVRCGKCVYPA